MQHAIYGEGPEVIHKAPDVLALLLTECMPGQSKNFTVSGWKSQEIVGRQNNADMRSPADILQSMLGSNLQFLWITFVSADELVECLDPIHPT